MRYSNILGAIFITASIGWGGFMAGKLFQPHPASLPAPQQAAVPAASPATTATANTPAPEPTPAAETAAPAVQLTEPETKAELASNDAAPAAETETSEVSAAPAVTSDASTDVHFEDIDLLASTEQQTVEATLRGNGRDRMNATLRNNSPTPLRVTIPAGQVLESGRNTIVVTRAAKVELMPARSTELTLHVAALHSANYVYESLYKPSYRSAERIEGFLLWASLCGELSTPTMQTAILALTENLPLSAFAKFTSVNSTAGQGHYTDAFRVETIDILAALTALRECGVKLETLALAQDPQLRIESMIEPLSREAAKRFYGISEESEWEFWKRELLEGNPTTRHYALFGIARFYPEIAVDMLPKWARETQTHPVYRLAAVQALADTQRPEALPILRQLAIELGPQTDLGKAATQSATYLDKRLTELSNRTQVVAFRDRTRLTGM